MGENTVTINRAPVLTLWAAVVAQALGHDEDTALTMGKAVAGLNAQTKGRSLGIYGPPKAKERGGEPKKKGLGEDYWVEICRRPVPVKETPEGVRAVVKDQPIDPAKVRKYLDSKFGEDLPRVQQAMQDLAESLEPERLGELSYELYEKMRPQIPSGTRGWGAKGQLDLDLIRSLAAEARE